MSKQFTIADVAKHNKPDDCWLIIGNAKNGGPKVYDVTKYLDDHPGGKEVVVEVAGTNADQMFEDIGHSKEARKELNKLLIGELKLTEAERLAMEEAAKESEKVGSGFSIVPVLVLIAAFVVLYMRQQGMF